MDTHTPSVATGQNSANTNSTTKSGKPRRDREITDEKKAECVKTLVEKLEALPEGSSINVNEVCDDFGCATYIANAIIREAMNRVRRFFEIDEENAANTSAHKLKLSEKIMPIGRTHFNKANKGRKEEDKFHKDDEFKIEFSKENLDVFTVTRVRPASASANTVEEV